jgi:precorrin-2 dehydrogenase/sirohydrochlorin ferrochelatase
VRCAYPLVLDVSKRPVVVIGGGAVAARKVQGLLDAGATRIRCVAPEFAPGFPGGAGIEKLTAAYERAHLNGASLVFAATDNVKVNATIAQDARRLGLLVNRADADEDEPGDFSTPAVIRSEELLITVSAGAPALVAAIRDGIRDRLDPRWIAMTRVMQELRPRITARADLPIESRRTALRDLASQEAMDVLDRDGIDGLWEWLKERNRAL